MDESNPLPEIPEFTIWEDSDGWHATWNRPLSLYETEADLADRVDVGHLPELETECASLRIRRDLINRPLHRAWRTEDLAGHFIAGDPT